MLKLQALVTFTERTVHLQVLCLETLKHCATLCTLREIFSVDLQCPVSSLQFLLISLTHKAQQTARLARDVYKQ
jgi:hypothetical protein